MNIFRKKALIIDNHSSNYNILRAFFILTLLSIIVS
jgi:hypothetical protein